MSHDNLSEMQAELERQNEAFEALKAEAATLGNVEIDVPPTFFDELDALVTATPPLTTWTPFTHALRA
jgi:hypothetical protein